MSTIKPEKILKSIHKYYMNQFNQKLDERLLQHVIDKELQKKREAFLQVQLATSCFDMENLLKLKKLLQQNQPLKKTEREPNSTESKSNKLTPTSSHDKDEIPSKSNSETSEEESAELKRRAYARAYYHRKKIESNGGKSSSSKNFKTTPEQRAYQRSYYKRKKSSALAIENQNALVKAFSAKKESDREIFGEDRKAPSAPQTESAEKNFNQLNVDYDGMASDRNAIDNAFRGESLNSMNFNAQEKSSIPFNTKTKLRKAKSQERTVS